SDRHEVPCARGDEACPLHPGDGHGPQGRRVAQPIGLSTDYALRVGRRCFLGHGASGSAARMTPYVKGLEARGIAAAAIDLPRRRAEDAVTALHPAVPR